jgi:hypothetical protein
MESPTKTARSRPISSIPARTFFGRFLQGEAQIVGGQDGKPGLEELHLGLAHILGL